MSWYKTGTIAVTNGSTSVTGTGTAFVGAVQSGWGLAGPDGRIYEVASITSATVLVLGAPYLGSTASGQTYACFPTRDLGALPGQLQTVISAMQATIDGAGAGKFGDGAVAAPGVSFVADADTGLYRPAANQIGVAVGGVQRLLLSGTAMQVDVPVTGTAVAQSSVDDVAGRLLRTGHVGTGRDAFATCGGTANALVLTTGGSLPSLPTGLKLRFIATAANTAAATVAVDGLAVKSIKTVTGAALPAGYIRTGRVTEMTYDGTNFIAERQIERGSNANGAYTKLADGTVIYTPMTQPFPNVVKRRRVTDAAWLSSTSAANNNWYSVCWAPELGLFCAVSVSGTGNRVMTSPDGIAWTARTSAADNNWLLVCWAPELGLFCAVAYSGVGNRVMTSPDGITWTARTSAVDNQWYSVCWSPELGLFCAVSVSGTGNRVMTSPDGITWTARTSAANNNWYSVCWSPELGLFCAVSISGTGNRVMTSPDGITWTARTSAVDNQWYSVCWAPELGLFCAVAYTGTGNRVMTSPDGITWTARTSAADNQWLSVCWAPELGLFCAVSFDGTGNRVMTSVSGYAVTYRS